MNIKEIVKFIRKMMSAVFCLIARELPESSSIYRLVEEAEKIEVTDDAHREMLGSILWDMNAYKKKNNLEYPPALKERISKLYTKLYNSRNK